MRALSAVALLFAGVGLMSAAEPTISLKLIAKKDGYAWPVPHKPAEWEALLKEAQKAIRDKKDAVVPEALSVDFVLRFTNTGDKPVEIFVKGDVNLLTLELNGPGVVILAPPRAMTLEFRLAQPVTIEAGKSFELPVGKLADGFRGVTRSLYFTAPGEYELKASYQLADSEEKKGTLLKTDAVRFTVAEPK